MPENFTREAVEGGSFKERIEALCSQIESAPVTTEREIVAALVLCSELEMLITEAANAAGGTLYEDAEIKAFYEKRHDLEERVFRKENKDGLIVDVRTPDLVRKAHELFDELSNPNAAK